MTSKSTLPADCIITFAMKKMQERIERKNKDPGIKQEQSGLIYMGNIHDAYPRCLLLDKRLSPTDKTAWLLIRHYAMQNEGAVFPAYRDLKNMLAEPGRISASSETVTRVLTMLRITGWLSLCKRVRDKNSGRIVGNIYAQHDEPLSAADCELFDPDWINLVERSCFSKNASIRCVAYQAVTDMKKDGHMRHRHSRVQLIEERLAAAVGSESEQGKKSVKSPCSDSEHGKKKRKKPCSDSEQGNFTLCSESEEGNNGTKQKPKNSAKSIRYEESLPLIRKPNSYVRNITHSVNNTYVRKKEPEQFITEDMAAFLPVADRAMINERLSGLSETQRIPVIQRFLQVCHEKQLRTPVGYLLKLIQKSHNNEFWQNDNDNVQVQNQNTGSTRPEFMPASEVCSEMAGRRADPQQVQQLLAKLRKEIQTKPKPV